MNRRRLITLSASAGLAIGLGAGYRWLQPDPNAKPQTIDAALLQLDFLEGEDLISIGQWNPYQIFTHAAQSIEYSMTGYPEQKSDLFKNTAGRVAFSVFESRGKMSHSLSEAIPGAPALAASGDTTAALQRLRSAFLDFSGYEGKLQPHFAYGQLSKKDYAAAHVLHLNNHLDEIAV